MGVKLPFHLLWGRMLTYVGFRYGLAYQGLICDLKHEELPGHMPNLAQLHRLSYVGPESQLRLSWAE